MTSRLGFTLEKRRRDVNLRIERDLVDSREKLRCAEKNFVVEIVRFLYNLSFLLPQNDLFSFNRFAPTSKTFFLSVHLIHDTTKGPRHTKTPENMKISQQHWQTNGTFIIVDKIDESQQHVLLDKGSSKRKAQSSSRDFWMAALANRK